MHSKQFYALLLSLTLLTNAAWADYPSRGMGMIAVQATYGQPLSVRHSTGPEKKRWPRITAWHYGSFTVYFERDKVLHTVVHQN